MDLSNMSLDEFFENICNSDLLEPPYRIDKAKQSAYMRAIFDIAKLKQEGKVEVVSIDDYEKPHALHTIHFNWVKDDGEWEVKAKSLSGILSCVDWLNVMEDAVSGEWQLSTSFYFPEE